METAEASELAARRAAVGAEADSLDTKIREARKGVDAYVARVAELVGPLEEFTNTRWAPAGRFGTVTPLDANVSRFHAVGTTT